MNTGCLHSSLTFGFMITLMNPRSIYNLKSVNKCISACSISRMVTRVLFYCFVNICRARFTDSFVESSYLSKIWKYGEQCDMTIPFPLTVKFLVENTVNSVIWQARFFTCQVLDQKYCEQCVMTSPFPLLVKFLVKIPWTVIWTTCQIILGRKYCEQRDWQARFSCLRESDSTILQI